MLRSLRGRLVVLLVLLVAAAIATGMLMVGLFRQSATAQVGQADAEIGRACDAIAGAYRFYSAGWQPVPALDDEPFRGGLTTVVQTALRNRPVGFGRAKKVPSPMPSQPTKARDRKPMSHRPNSRAYTRSIERQLLRIAR